MWVQLIGHTTYLLLALSYVVRDILWLRCFAVIASCTSITYNYFAKDEPLWLVINWNFVFLAINIFRIVRIFLEKRDIQFSPEEQELAETVFEELTPLELMKLLRIGQWRDASPDQLLLTEDAKVDDVMLIYSGEVKVYDKTQERGRRRPGNFIGEMSFVSNQVASANVKTTMPCRYLAFPQEGLRRLITREPSLGIKIHQILAADLTQKIKNA